MRDALIHDVLEIHRAILRAAHATAATRWFELELTMAQLKTLVALAEEGPAPIGTVAEMLQVSLPTASHLVDRLVVARLAERAEDPADRRRTLARLSPKGEELVLCLRQGGREHFRAWLEQLDETELAALRTGLQAIQRIAEQETAERTHGDPRPVP